MAEKKDGLFFAQLVKNCRELERKNDEKNHLRFYQEITPFATNVRPKDEQTYNYPCFNCGTGGQNIGFLPNRLISSCHNGFVDILEDYQANFLANPDSSIDAKLFQPTRSKFTHTEADYVAYERQVSHYNSPGSLCRMGCLAGFIRTLALAGEIEEKYATEEGAFRGAELYQSCTCNCLRDNFMVTGSTSLQPEGMIKLLLFLLLATAQFSVSSDGFGEKCEVLEGGFSVVGGPLPGLRLRCFPGCHDAGSAQR